jgi:hypothetical protein
MKRIARVLLLLTLFLGFTISHAETPAGHTLLFEGVKSVLSEEEQKDIFSKLEFTTTKTAEKLKYEGEDASPEVEVTDLNGDGVNEVFVSYGTWITCGQAERCLALFIKDAKGKYTRAFDLPASGYERQTTANKGFPDLAFDDPGFCRGIWRWNGTKYEHFKNVPVMEGGCDAIEKRRLKR